MLRKPYFTCFGVGNGFLILTTENVFSRESCENWDVKRKSKPSLFKSSAWITIMDTVAITTPVWMGFHLSPILMTLKIRIIWLSWATAELCLLSWFKLRAWLGWREFIRFRPTSHILNEPCSWEEVHAVVFLIHQIPEPITDCSVQECHGNTNFHFFKVWWLKHFFCQLWRYLEHQLLLKIQQSFDMTLRHKRRWKVLLLNNPSR